MAKKPFHHRLLLFSLAKSSPSCLQRERYFSRCGASRERKGENVVRHPLPARGRCAAKRSLPQALLARSSVQEGATPRRSRLLPGTFCQILVDDRTDFWLSARRPLLVLPPSLHVKLLLTTNWWSDFTTSYAPRTDSNVNEQTIQGHPQTQGHWKEPRTSTREDHVPTESQSTTPVLPTSTVTSVSPHGAGISYREFPLVTTRTFSPLRERYFSRDHKRKHIIKS